MDLAGAQTDAGDRGGVRLIKWLTCMMFLMFAMTSDAVGSIIPTLIKEYHLSMTAAGAFHYVPMTAIAVGAILFGFLADRIGRKRSVVIGLVVYGTSCLLFAFGNNFAYFVALFAAAGTGISIFKTGALALVGDISQSTAEHSSLMNTVEGCFGIGAIIGPSIVAALLLAGMSWKWLYVMAAAVCALLVLLAMAARYPVTRSAGDEPANLAHTMGMVTNPYAMGFSVLIMLYVAVEVAIYVWMPTYLSGYRYSIAWLPAYALTIFFVLRAGGRLMGAWLLARCQWTVILAVFGVAIFACFLGALLGGPQSGAFLLPLSGLFMSMIYPTLNSKGISCFRKSEHGAVAGVILFFTALAAALGPLAMAAVSDAYGDVKYGFFLATAFSFLLMAGLVFNLVANPTKRRLQQLDEWEYASRPAAAMPL